MAKNAKIERSQKLFLAAMKKKFSEDPSVYTPGNIQQNPKEHVTLIPYKEHIFDSMEGFIGSLEMDL